MLRIRVGLEMIRMGSPATPRVDDPASLKAQLEFVHTSPAQTQLCAPAPPAHSLAASRSCSAFEAW
jgi:hypothetical protein